MDRRKFIRTTAGMSLAAATAAVIGNFELLFGALPPADGDLFDLVAVRNGEPDVMFDQAMEALGGMSAFVKPGYKVVIKPNIGWDVAPERAANTHPGLIRHIVSRCFGAGASKVYVFDNTCDEWRKCYQNSGIEPSAKEAGATVVPANAESYYLPVEIPAGKRLKSAKVHKVILESDMVINVPVLKHHSSADLSIAMKNLMGIVWDRTYWHRNDLHQCIADFTTWRVPELNVVDAYRVMMQNGPRGVSVEDVATFKSMIVSTDIVAADTAAARLFGAEPGEIDYIRYAAEAGTGTNRLEQLNIKRIKL
ncbi:MAG: DUF362 domain-containing protein [Bacteroidales bacterium]